MGFLGKVVSAVSEGANAVSEGASSVWDKASEYVPEVSDVVETVAAVANPVGAVLDSGGISQGVGDVMETVGNVVGPGAGAIPGVGEILSGLQAAYHVGAGTYDAVTGDRDGAITHGAQGVGNVLGMVPGLSEGLGLFDMGLGQFGGAAKLGAGADAPQSFGDLLAHSAVQTTNTIFGKDDSNWFASGDSPTGTRRGEIGAGLFAMMPHLAVLDPISDTADYIKGKEPTSRAPGHAAGNLVGDLFSTPKNAPTLGAGKPNAAQKTGQETHKQWTNLFSGLFD